MIKIDLPAGTIKRIHVNRMNIAHNAKTGDRRPQWVVQTSKGPISCHRVNISGSVAGSGPDDPQLGCGARVYLTTKAKVQVFFDSEYDLENLTKRAKEVIGARKS